MGAGLYLDDVDTEASDHLVARGNPGIELGRRRLKDQSDPLARVVQVFRLQAA